MNFQFIALEAQIFSHLQDLTSDELKLKNIIEYIADSDFGYPCRLTLQDAQAGDELLLLNYRHHNVENPYASSHAIFIKKNAQSIVYDTNQVPPIVRNREQLAARAFDKNNLMIEARLTSGHNIEQTINQLFKNDECCYLHIHNAARGCYLAQVINKK